MKIGVVGNGVVGRATARCYLEHVEKVCVYDKIPELCPHGMLDILQCDLIFVCLPEAVVEEFFAALKGSPAHWVLKSTVPIGTTRRLAKQYRLANLVHSPEFITERCALTDAQMPARNIIGEPQRQRDTPYGHTTNKAGLEYGLLCGKRFPGVPTLYMSSDESEAVKLMTNAFFATKVAFFNEMYQLAQLLGLDWETVRAGILSDGRIAHSHTQVPGPDGRFGFGGRCLPKDLEMLRRQIEATSNNAHANICWAALTRNEMIDRKEP